MIEFLGDTGIKVLCGVLLTLLCALYIVFTAWRREAEKRTEAEEKVKAHEALQEIDEDIANGGDGYINDQLLSVTRDLRCDRTGNDIKE